MKRAAWLWIAAAGCGVSEELYNARVADLNRTRAEMDKAGLDAQACRRDVAGLSEQNGVMKKHLEAIGADVDKLSTERGALEKALHESQRREEELRKQQEQAEKRAATFRGLLDRLKSMIDAGQLQVEVRDGRMLVKLSDQILFEPGKTALKPAGVAALKEVGQALGAISDRKFQVAGHTDNVPISSARFKSNWELSTARAVEVVRILSANGVEAKRLSAAGYAEFAPLGGNETAEGRARNRRTEIILQPNIDELPAGE